MGTTTRAIVVTRVGGPEVLEARQIPLAAPRPGEARVRHTAIGLNFIDVYFRSAVYPPPPHPYVPGFEAAGVVEAVGPQVTEVSVGDRVAYTTGPMGSYAELRNVSQEFLVRLPAGVDDVLAAALMLKGLTAQYLLRRTFRVERGHTLLVHAAAGGVGSLLCQWASGLGATVIGTVGSEAKAARAREDGCAHVIVTPREDFVARVNELTGGAGVHVVYDSVGRATFERSLECLAPLGMMVSFGQSSGMVEEVQMGWLAKRSLFLTRPSLLLYDAKRPDLLAGAAELFEMLATGRLRAHVDQRFPLAEAAAAQRALESRATTGSTVLIP